MTDQKPEFEPRPRTPKEYERAGIRLINSTNNPAYGYSPSDLRLLGGGNYLTGVMRVLHEVQERSVDVRQASGEPRPLQDELVLLKPPFGNGKPSHKPI